MLRFLCAGDQLLQLLASIGFYAVCLFLYYGRGRHDHRTPPGDLREDHQPSPSRNYSSPADNDSTTTSMTPPGGVAALRDEDPDVLAERQRVEQWALPSRRSTTACRDENAVEPDPILVLKNLQKIFHPSTSSRGGGPVHAVRGIDFFADTPGVFGLLGLNGAGKTTTFKMMLGLETPTAGQVFIRPDSRIGYCPQFDTPLFGELSVWENLCIYARLKIPSIFEEQERQSSTRRTSRSRLTDLILDLDLGPYLDRKADLLSGGNKRKVCIAIALLGSPKVLFLDEPSTGQDSVAKRRLWRAIRKYVSLDQSLCILCTHSMEEAENLCDRVAIQVAGRWRCLGSPAHLRAVYGGGYELLLENTSSNTKPGVKMRGPRCNLADSKTTPESSVRASPPSRPSREEDICCISRLQLLPDEGTTTTSSSSRSPPPGASSPDELGGEQQQEQDLLEDAGFFLLHELLEKLNLVFHVTSMTRQQNITVRFPTVQSPREIASILDFFRENTGTLSRTFVISQMRLEHVFLRFSADVDDAVVADHHGVVNNHQVYN
ncbi:unnamed protein product [Amoebophrya sp. A25]|nr:unnamed protein product [Amoebophrya sp. A25]|eukprot:GSA25T00008749001.1